MKALVVFESMFGNTRAVAEAVADGLRSGYDVEVRSAGAVAPDDLRQVQLLVAGGPTHVHGMSRPRTRQGALRQIEQGTAGPRLESGATGPGLLELFAGVTGLHARAAAFDTRVNRSPLLTGRAGPKIARLMRRSGAHAVCRPQSFLVDGDPAALLPGELDRAREWAEHLASREAVRAR